MKYTYRLSEPGVWAVGYYTPSGTWVALSGHGTREKAAKRVNYLEAERQLDREREAETGE